MSRKLNKAYRFTAYTSPRKGILHPSGIVDVHASSLENARRSIASSQQRFAAGHARQDGEPVAWQVCYMGQVVDEGLELPEAGANVTRCPECKQTVRVVNGTIQTHNRIRGGKGEQCPGSGRTA